MTDTYNAQADFAGSLDEGYRAIREREAAKPEDLRNYDFARSERQPQKIEDRPFGVPA
jgi:hypothetical protein